MRFNGGRLRRRMALIAAGLCCILWLAPGLCAETINRIIAIVNDEVITQGDVELAIGTNLAEQGRPAPSKDEMAGMARAILQQLIQDRLILAEAKRLEVSIGSEEVEERLESLRGKFDSNKAFEDSLLTRGLSTERLKKHLRSQLLIKKIIDWKIRSTIAISPQEVAQGLRSHPEFADKQDRVRGSHILVRVTEGRTESQAKGLIESISQRLKAGGEFAALAKQHSEDVNTQQGGAMGWVAEGELMPELDAVIFDLEEGAVSSPIQSRLGFHIFKVEQRSVAANRSEIEASNLAYQKLYRQKFQMAIGRWLEELEGRAYIEIVSPEGSIQASQSMVGLPREPPKCGG